MCGGIVGTLNAALPVSARSSGFSQIVPHITYNSGRILSYSIAGTFAGLAGAQLSYLPFEKTFPFGALISGLFMLGLGLYLAGWWPSFSRVEIAGQFIWRFVKPLGQRFLPADTPVRTLGLGLIWGWLPCGLVYSVLALAFLSASPLQGAVIMVGFGLGTLPMLLAMGTAHQYLRLLARNSILRWFAGLILILYGVAMLVAAFAQS